ncbi:unnamed protein product [Timema podura]|uniref:Uncharacterized protein n=1 Tax=Timema podura TaxID=61482 RepID=A0ABN7P1P9_TIMPD|nr:unnamed protein product [Timema podura]
MASESIHICFLLAECKPTQLHKRKRWTVFISSRQADPTYDCVYISYCRQTKLRYCKSDMRTDIRNFD